MSFTERRYILEFIQEEFRTLQQQQEEQQEKLKTLQKS